MNVDSIVDKLLEARGCETEEQKRQFLNPNYSKDLHDPFLLPDISKAIRRLDKAKQEHQKVIIYGDYDIDGICSVAILTEALTKLGIDVENYIPNRYEEGYGINKTALDKLHQKGAQLIIAVDCGTNSVQEINHIQRKSVDVIVIDHHQVSGELPKAAAVLNPAREDSEYPFTGLSAVGLTFKFIQALQREYKLYQPGQEKWLLDLVAFGTVCDQVKLLDENRALVYWGLKVFSKTRRLGLISLAEVCTRDLREVDSNMLGYIFGPRLNASGRLTHAKKSLDLLLTKSKNEADLIAGELEISNQERRTIQNKIEKEATQQAESFANDRLLVLSSKHWSHGIVGIVASRLMEKYKKPVFIGQEIGNCIKGSARSFGDFSAAEAIMSAKSLLISGGGHQAAAGFSISTHNLNQFRLKLNEFYASLDLKNQDEKLSREPEIVLRDLTLISHQLIEDINKLEPFGNGNQRPMAKIDDLLVTDIRKVGQEEDHTKLKMKDGKSNFIDGIAFYNSLDINRGDKITLIGNIEEQVFNDRHYLQINIKSAEAL